MPTNGESDVPAPVPYSLDDAEGRFAASCETVDGDVDVLLFVFDETELTFTDVSSGTFADADWPVVVAGGVPVAATPDDSVPVAGGVTFCGGGVTVCGAGVAFVKPPVLVAVPRFVVMPVEPTPVEPVVEAMPVVPVLVAPVLVEPPVLLEPPPP